MLHHLSFAVSDLGRAAALYDAVFRPLGFAREWADDTAVGYGYPGGGDKFALKQVPQGASIPGEGFHLAFTASSRAAVDASFAPHVLTAPALT